ncbi:MAG TPA: hypothetical protein VIW68_01710 [Candidatus Sulfotelmatobacter sp.]
MARMIDQIRASKLPSNMMQFAAKGALSVGPAENIEILVYLARHNKVFGDLARMTLAGWDEKSSLQAASDPKSPQEVLDYLVAPDNLRPKLLPALLENSSVRESELAKLAQSASPDSIVMMLKSPRVRAAVIVLNVLKANPYLKKEQSDEIRLLMQGGEVADAKPAAGTMAAPATLHPAPPVEAARSAGSPAAPADTAAASENEGASSEEEEAVAAFFFHHAAEIAADEGKPFQAIGGIVELLGSDYFPASPAEEVVSEPAPAPATAAKADEPNSVPAAKPVPDVTKRVNTVQKINALGVKGRIQLALKGTKEERSILVRDGTKVVALAVLEAPKLSDGEVEKFASQKNVLEAVLRQIPLKRRFMKNYKVVRNLVANPRTPLDLGLGLMKNLLSADLKNISGNKEVSETIRKLALKMYKQKEDQANKK